MNTRRLGTRITASFEALMTKLESHRALADSKIQAVKKTAVKVSTHLGLARYRLQKLLRREAELEASIQRWRFRAVSQSELNQNKALRCVQALNKSQELLDQIRTQLALERRLENDLQVYLTELQDRLKNLEKQRDKFLADEQSTETPYNIMPLFGEAGVEDMHSHCGKPLNASSYGEDSATVLEAAFNSKQNREQLRRQLIELCKKAKGVKRNPDEPET